MGTDLPKSKDQLISEMTALLQKSHDILDTYNENTHADVEYHMMELEAYLYNLRHCDKDPTDG